MLLMLYTFYLVQDLGGVENVINEEGINRY